MLLPLMDWLESTKKDMADNEAISSEVSIQKRKIFTIYILHNTSVDGL